LFNPLGHACQSADGFSNVRQIQQKRPEIGWMES
jgi:hypothetical protein